ncbi:hypothetical protein EWM64_g1833 [Hericium alpestre]|uniref:Uncharacterized protein n=1 Tax=Hericium alpestre TaxID=135208 RepID=A0A4Z0A588_9AGAM|nr:hypothetical protein EWM64_g1833 [Hericium alpestre]
MEPEPGDDYIHRIANFIKTNEPRLAEGGFSRRRRVKKPAAAPAGSLFNPLSWFGTDSTAQTQPSRPKPLVFTIDTHRLFYLLMRLEALGFDVGSLDVKVDSPSRPMNYIEIFPGADRSDAMSMSSIRSSFSAVSKLSLGPGWWGRAEPPSINEELKYIFSSFTKMPVLHLQASGPKKIAELANEPPNQNALPLDTFRNLQSLECSDVDPRTLLGWDRLAESLWSLTIKRSGLDDVSDVFIGAVLDDQARRRGAPVPQRRKSLRDLSRQSSFNDSQLPESISEETEEPTPTDEKPPLTMLADSTDPQLPSSKWAFLRHLSLADNALTFIPTAPLPSFTSLSHLDLSSNLLVSIPPGLSILTNLSSLNLSDNMIDSVVGIYKQLGQILTLNLSRNRLESICGLERLMALERVDVRYNQVEESAEIGRLATLPNITEIWVEGNPFVETEADYRIKCFDFFRKEGKSILVDGTAAGYYEKRNLTSSPAEQMTSTRPVSKVYSPPTVPVGTAVVGRPASSEASSSNSPLLSPSSSPYNVSPFLAATTPGKARKKKAKRIVDLNGQERENSDHASVRTTKEIEPAVVRKDVAPTQSTVSEASARPRRTTSPTHVSPFKNKHRRSQTDAYEPPDHFAKPSFARSSFDPSGSISGKARSAARRSRVIASSFERPRQILGR